MRSAKAPRPRPGRSKRRSSRRKARWRWPLSCCKTCAWKNGRDRHFGVAGLASMMERGEVGVNCCGIGGEPPLPACGATRFTRLENRLKDKDLDDPRSQQDRY